jgi:hypothetical protein
LSTEDLILEALYKRPPVQRHNSGPSLTVEEMVFAELELVIDNEQVTEEEQYDAIRRAMRRLIADGKIESRAMWIELAIAFEDRGVTQ